MVGSTSKCQMQLASESHAADGNYMCLFEQVFSLLEDAESQDNSWRQGIPIIDGSHLTASTCHPVFTLACQFLSFISVPL